MYKIYKVETELNQITDQFDSQNFLVKENLMLSLLSI